jgi:hypothetical protein
MNYSVVRRLVGRLFGVRIFAINMQAPQNGLLGLLASKVMTSANKLTSEHVADKLNVNSNDCVVELGPGKEG